jgi:hypothetical protein
MLSVWKKKYINIYGVLTNGRSWKNTNFSYGFI